MTAIACAGSLSSYHKLTRDYDSPKFIYEINDDNTFIITGIDEGGNELSAIKVPRTIEGKNVTAIGEKVFSELNDPYHNVADKKDFVILPDTIVTIEDYAFYNSSIDEITIPDSVREIKSKAFSCTQIKSVTVPKNAKIADNAFSKDITITYK